ncbi:MAG: hypothetical protein OXH85_10895 [Truepera sp.]|nr:hypothetical protein [Truepera sp.]
MNESTRRIATRPVTPALGGSWEVNVVTVTLPRYESTGGAQAQTGPR